MKLVESWLKIKTTLTILGTLMIFGVLQYIATLGRAQYEDAMSGKPTWYQVEGYMNELDSEIAEYDREYFYE